MSAEVGLTEDERKVLGRHAWYDDHGDLYGYVISDDREGKNAGRPVRQMRATSRLFADADPSP